jgi:hypothetical protein
MHARSGKLLEGVMSSGCPFRITAQPHRMVTCLCIVSYRPVAGRLGTFVCRVERSGL